MSARCWFLTRLIAAIPVAAVLHSCSNAGDQPSAATSGGPPTPSVQTSRPECAQIARQFSDALSKVHAESPVERLAEIRTAAAAAGEDPAGCNAGRLADLVTEQRRKLLRLFIDDREAPPTAIYECPRLEANFRCEGAVADDTAHLGELASTPAASSLRNVRIELARDYAPLSTTPYLLKTPNGPPEAAVFPLRSVPSLYAIVVLVQERDTGYVKYVWLTQLR